MLQSNANKGGVRTTGNRDVVKGCVGPHKNAITDIQAMDWSGEACTKFSTCGLDGRIVVWNVEATLKKLELA